MTHLTPEIAGTIRNANSVRVQEIARELAGYGLAVSMPHCHDKGLVSPLPINLIQYEKNLCVSFVDKKGFEQDHQSAYPVMWRFNPHTEATEPCAYCCDPD